MYYFAIGSETHFAYQGGNRSQLEKITPMPVITPILLNPEEFFDEGIIVNGCTKHIFVEDYFDATTRVRRGRLYKREEGHQPVLTDVEDFDSTIPVVMYQREPLIELPNAPLVSNHRVKLGSNRGFTLWTIVSFEFDDMTLSF